jgi:hypothetical protein
MSKTKKRNSSRKGDYGYLASEKKRRILITAVLFAVPLLIFFSAMLYFHTRLTIWTVIAVVGCLPACKSLVSLIMIFRARQVETSVYRRIHEHAGELTMSYEMYMTFYEKSANIFTRLDPFLERLDSMNAHKESLEEGIKFRPDEKYPELSRNELIKHTILAICL